jgi:hypothetical protein
MAQKGKRLSGGAISEEAVASSPTVLGTSARGQAAGLQQFFSPAEVAELCRRVWADEPDRPMLDIAAGDGSLLAEWPAEMSFGVEIDPDQAKAAKGRYTPLLGDLQRLYPLLRASGLRFPRVVANPPWGLKWQIASLNGGRAASSTLLGLKMALGVLAPDGEGLLITAADRFRREVEPDEASRLIWCTVEVPDLFEGVKARSVIAFLVGAEARAEGESIHFEAKRAELVDLGVQINETRRSRVEPSYSYLSAGEVKEAFEAIAEEHGRRLRAERSKRPSYDVRLRGKRIGVGPSAFAQVALRESEGFQTLRTVEGFNNKPLTYLALNLRDWRLIERFGEEGVLRLDPALADAAERALAEVERELCPLYEVRPQMRLGFLEELDRIRCTRSDPERSFQAGEIYPISTRSQIHSSSEERPYEKRDGTLEIRKFVKQRKLLQVRIGAEEFDEGKEAIEYLLEHFEIPDPGHIGDRFPAEMARARAILDSFPERFGWAEKGIEWKDLEREGGEIEVWQREDLVRMIVKGSGALLGWEQGGGKTLGLTALALGSFEYWGLARQALFVVPQDLIPQWQREVRKFFDLEFEPIDSIAKARSVRRAMHAGREGFYITWYELLSLSGARRETSAPVAVRLPPQADRAGRPREVTLSSEEACPSCHTLEHEGWSGETCSSCGYVHRSLEVRCAASQLSTAFRRGVICVDELSLVRGKDSRRSKAIRALRAACRYGGSGTPISNYVNDAFWGLWWALGNATSRFPYDYHGGPTQFQADFCVVESLMGREEDGEGNQKKRVKVLPEVTNVSVLWRLLAAGLVRRRQEDMGKMVPRREVPVEVPMGRVQQRLHKGWLTHFPAFFTARNPHHPLVANGAVERFSAVLGELAKLEYAATLPPADPDAAWILDGKGDLGASYWTPAMLKVLELALKHVREGEKVLIGSGLVETGHFIAERLCERGVGAVHIVEETKDGKYRTKNPRRRAAEIAAFAQGGAQVLCTGVQAVKLGHSLEVASVAIVLGFPWSHEAIDQFIKRVHRLTSVRPVTIYFVYPKGSMGERKRQLLDEKGAAADLALDGQLIDIPEEPIDWRKVTKEMKAAGAELSSDDTIEEATLEALWAKAEGAYAPLAPALRLLPTPAIRPEREPVDPEQTEQLELFAEAA